MMEGSAYPAGAEVHMPASTRENTPDGKPALLPLCLLAPPGMVVLVRYVQVRELTCPACSAYAYGEGDYAPDQLGATVFVPGN